MSKFWAKIKFMESEKNNNNYKQLRMMNFFQKSLFFLAKFRCLHNFRKPLNHKQNKDN